RDILMCFTDDGQGIPVLTGPQGIGKTSLLNVLSQLLLADVLSDQYKSLGLTGFAPPSVPRIVHWVRCDHTLVTPTALSERMLDEFARLAESPAEETTSASPEYSVSAAVPVRRVATAARDIGSGIDGLVRSLTDQADEVNGEVVLMLDECEHLPWLEDLFGFVRRFPRSKVKFVLAMRGHALDSFRRSRYDNFRLPHGIDLPGLEEAENGQISSFFEQKVAALKAAGVDFYIDPAALALIVRKSGGEPWYLHMLGNELLKGSSDTIMDDLRLGNRHEVIVDTESVRAAERAVAATYLHGLYTSQYRTLCGRAPKREEVLRAIAQLQEPTVSSEFVAHMRIERGGDPAEIMRRLAEDHGVLERDGRSWRFTNHQFRVYCRLAVPCHELNAELAGVTVESWARRSGDPLGAGFGYE
ncbi:MAG: AAA family ATPase, partial [Sulfitobacter sp.]|nr:AAA family ATPase [Sulfitobacter sp.]